MNNLRKLTIILLLFVVWESYAQTSFFSGPITSDTTWSSDTLNITGEVVIDSNVTLTVMPGTFVHILGYYAITSYGSIRAIGTENDSIVFTHLDTLQHADTSTIAGGWHGIRLLPRTASDTSIFKYCRIANGKAVIPGSWVPDYQKPGNCGGNIYALDFGSLIMEDCFIRNGKVKGNGGGLSLENGDYVSILRCTFADNYAYVTYGGGAMVKDVDQLFIKYNLFHHNTCFQISYFPTTYGGNGGGLAAMNFLGYDSYALIESNRFFNNKTTGGVLYDGCYHSDVTGNVLCNNYGMALWQAHMFNYPVLTNNIVANNAGGAWSGIQVSTDDAVLIDNIAWGNRCADYPNIRIEQIVWQPLATAPPTVEYSCVEFGFDGTGNTDLDPLFVNPTAGVGLEYDGLSADWTLLDNSPCINAGTPDTSGLYLPATDITGNPRIYGNRIDMGAYENQHIWVGAIVSTDKNGLVTAYPNPARSLLTIDTPRATEGLCTLYDMSGQLIRSFPVTPPSTTLSVAGLPSGLYLWKVVQGHTVSSGKVVVE